MRIATVGSCLSRQTARAVPFSRILNSVYHNRSDRLLETLLASGENLKPHDELCRLLKIDPGEDGEFAAANLLRNQSAEGFGAHRLPDHAPFHKTLASACFDMILVDNFMDLGARLYQIADAAPCFCRYPRAQAPAGHTLGRRLAPEESADNFRQILSLLRSAQPAAQIVFIHFPTGNYPKARQDRANAFLECLKVPDGVQVIRPRAVRPRFADREPQHFRRSEYWRYAMEVLSLRARWRWQRAWRTGDRESHAGVGP